MFDQPRQRIGAAIEYEIVAELANVGLDLEIRRDLFGMDERAIEPGFDAVMQKDGVERGARGRFQPERDVRDAERRQHARQLALDASNALDRFDRRRQKLGFAGRERKRQRVEDQRAGRQPVFIDGNLVDAPRDLELAFRGLCHAGLVDR